MQKLKRTYETAEEEGRPVEEVALERYGTLDAFEEAKEERRILDERAERKAGRGRVPQERGTPGKDEFGRDIRPQPGAAERYMFNDFGGETSRASSRASSFRKPGTQGSTPPTPQPIPGDGPPAATRRLEALRGGPGRTGPSTGVSTPEKPSTPIPSALTPTSYPGKPRAMSPSSLNKLQAKVLRAKLMGQGDSEELEKQYQEELRRAQSGDADDDGVRVEMVPTIDGRGRMYDIGTGKGEPSGPSKVMPGNRKKKEVVRFGDLPRGNSSLIP